ncbi:MAG TPA: 6-phosphogluconolactonase [bacterium]|jgi:6-phosphogluconolactonase
MAIPENRRIFIAANHEEASRTAANIFVKAAKSAVEDHGTFRVALSGGGTPKRMYELLVSDEFGGEIQWDAVQIYFADERCVPLDDDESNYRLVKETILNEVSIPENQIHKMYDGEIPLEKIPEIIGREYNNRLDMIVLGMGDDGHTASLFPGSEIFDGYVGKVAVISGPKPPNPRVTITPGVMEEAAELLMIATGAGKAFAVQAALEGILDARQCPAQIARRGIWVLDEGSSGNLAKQ